MLITAPSKRIHFCQSVSQKWPRGNLKVTEWYISLIQSSFQTVQFLLILLNDIQLSWFNVHYRSLSVVLKSIRQSSVTLLWSTSIILRIPYIRVFSYVTKFAKMRTICNIFNLHRSYFVILKLSYRK